MAGQLCVHAIIIPTKLHYAIIRTVMTILLQAPVLVLNANYEPLNVCNMRRAIGLMMTGKASMVLDGRGEIRSVSNSFACPSIIRLQRMIRRPRPRVKLTKNEVFRRDNHTCQYCGRHTPDPTIDHVVPRRLGGAHAWENLVTACSTCNHRKGGRTIGSASMALLRRPKVPPASARYIFGRYLNNNTDWVDYIEGW